MTLTNGVSFALVAGACCLVCFTKGFYKSGTYNDTTLNINSSGAKPMVLDYASNSFSSGHRSLFMLSTAWEIPYTLLWIFDGTNYLFHGMHYYSDYSD